MASTLTEPQNNAFEELKKLIQDGINSYQLTSFEGEVATMWGVPLVGDRRSKLILLKFLKAKDYKVLNAFAMIKNTLSWRKDVGIESLLREDLGNCYDKVVFTHGHDKEGCPVWYMALGELLNTNLSQTTSSVVENQHKFFCWLIQFTEKNIRRLDFSIGGANSFVLVIDFCISPWRGSRDLHKVVNKFLHLLRGYYPGLVAKELWVNTSWWHRCYSRVYSLVFEKWSVDNHVVFAGSSKTTETLFKYISPAQVPVKYDGLNRDDKQKLRRFNTDDPVSEASVKPAGKHTVEFSFAEPCDVFWELRVIGWEVSYEAEFVPSMKGRYITIISKPKNFTASDRPVISDSFAVSEPGKLVLTVHNLSSKRKQILSRVRVVASGGLDVADEASLRGWLVQSIE